MILITTRFFCVFDRDGHESYERALRAVPRYADVERQLRAIPEHSSCAKGARNLFALTKDQLDHALANADRANARAAENSSDNPTTQMPCLIRYLCELAVKKNL